MLAQTVYAAQALQAARPEDPEPVAFPADDSDFFTLLLGVPLPVALFRLLIVVAFLCGTTSVALLAVAQSELSSLHQDHAALFAQVKSTNLLINQVWADVQEMPAASGIIDLGQLLQTENEILQEELITIQHNVTTLALELRALVGLLGQLQGR